MQQTPSNFTIGMLIFPKMTQLDFTGPFEVFARIPETKVHVLTRGRTARCPCCHIKE